MADQDSLFQIARAETFSQEQNRFMDDPFDIAKTTPLFEPKPAAAPDPAVNFTPVDVPTQKPQNLTGMLVATFDYVTGVQVKPASIYCPYCGKKSSGVSDLFCLSCGEFLDPDETGKITEELAAEPPGLACEECGASINPEEIFCMSCGSVAGL